MMEDQAPIVSLTAFKWFLTILTGGLAGSWLVYDAFNLVRLHRKVSGAPKGATMDASSHDKYFGYVIGVLIGVIGVWGCLRFHGVV
jgi:hypothetical protein